MKSVKTMLSGAALALGVASSAQAVTFTDIAPGEIFSFEFSWQDTPYTEVHTFGIGFDFDLSLLDYSGVGAEQTGYYIDTDGTRLTTSSNACDSAGGSFVGGCDLVTGSTPPGTVLFSNQSAGVYTFGIYDSKTPTSGYLSFRVDKVSPVPVPAGGALLLGALGAFGLLRRRNKA